MSLAKRTGEKENPNHVVSFVSRPESNKNADYREDEYQLLPTAVFSYIDYLEIKEARINATDARKLSLLAIEIAIWSMLLSILVGLFGIAVQVMLD